jgi:hypothetical protein
MESLVQRYSTFFGISVYDTKNKDIIKNKYKQLVKKYHPDSGGTDDDFQYLGNAYQYLLNYNYNGEETISITDSLNIVIELEVPLDDLLNGFEHQVKYTRYIKDIGTLDSTEVNTTLFISSKSMNKQGYLIYRDIGHQQGNKIGHYIIMVKIIDYKLIIDKEYKKYPALYKEIRVIPNSSYSLLINNETTIVTIPQYIKTKHFITILNKGLIFNDNTIGSVILRLKQ